MLDQIFMQIIDMNNLASIMIVIVLLLRIVLKRIPKFVSYVLWSVVLFRLLCPFSIPLFSCFRMVLLISSLRILAYASH